MRAVSRAYGTRDLAQRDGLLSHSTVIRNPRKLRSKGVSAPGLRNVALLGVRKKRWPHGSPAPRKIDPVSNLEYYFGVYPQSGGHFIPVWHRMAWTQEPSVHYVSRRKFFAKKRWRELDAVERNLNTYFVTLNEGTKPAQIKYGFVKSHYQHGVHSLTQQGKGAGNLAETRLYVYADTSREVLWLLTIGDKNTQEDDVQACYTLVSELERSQGEKDASREEGEGGSGGT